MKTVSIRYKIALPVLLLACVILLVSGLSYYSLQSHQETSISLAERYKEIEEVRHIEFNLTQLIHPLVLHATTTSPGVVIQARMLFTKIEDQVSELNAMEVVNDEEREILELINTSVKGIKEVSSVLFNENNHMKKMQLITTLTEQHVQPLVASIATWHDDEIKQVEALLEEQKQQGDQFTAWVVASITLAISTIVFTLWLNNSIVVRPIMSLTGVAAQLARGNFKNKAPVFSSDEIGNLASDINEMALSLDNMTSQLRSIAHSDILTGLKNRRAFEDDINKELSRSSRHQHELAIILFDVDHFKNFNDEYGHDVGDLVLQNVSKIAEQSTRDYDSIYRYGGEEFIIILPKTGPDDALIVAERCRKAIASSHLENSQQDLNVTCSFGIATFPAQGQTKSELVKSADQALYLAKQDGRNCIKSMQSPA